MRRHSLGTKIEVLLSDILELVCEAQFSPKEERPSLVSRAIIKNDSLKFMLTVLWELGGLKETHFIELATRFEEIGRMLYGWKQKMLSEQPARPDGRSGGKPA